MRLVFGMWSDTHFLKTHNFHTYTSSEKLRKTNRKFRISFDNVFECKFVKN